MSIYKRDFNKTKCMYFLMKNEKLFDKTFLINTMKFGKKLAILSKKIILKLYIIRNCFKAKKK